VMTVEDAGAVGDAVRVTVAEQVGLQGLLENAEAVTPVGSVVSIVNVTGVVVAPVARVAVAVSTPPAAPSVIDSVAGAAAIVKLKKPETAKVKVVVWVTVGVPPLAWIVITVDDAGALAAAVKETVALHVGLHGLFENAEAVTPVGRVVRMLKVTGAVVAPRARFAVAASTPQTAPYVFATLGSSDVSVKSKKPETTNVNVVV